MSLLERILVQKRSELAELERTHLPAPPPRRPVDLQRAPGEPLALIAEIKRRSPSAGALSSVLDAAARAAAYAHGGARSVSVLTDHAFFGGAWSDLARARAACALPVLCKDFVIDERQLDAARAFGADLVLVIVRCLAPERVAELVAAARARELEPLVEVTNEAEARLALDAGATLVGVNARDLDTLSMDAERAARVLAGLPDTVVRVHLSGLATAQDIARVAASRADAALVGEALMRQDDPVALLSAMVAAAEHKP